MFRKIYVPVDNSEHSKRAVEVAVDLARAFGAALVGAHVYAARLHDYRFRQMEYTLPDAYRDEAELERQRTIHDSLIAMGLRLISDSYLEVVARRAAAAGVAFEARTMEGKHYRALLEDLRRGDCDLVVMGALGMGAVRDSQLGSVTERFVRHVTTDTLVVRHAPGPESRAQAIVVGLDGSPQSFHGLRLGIAMARGLGRPLRAVAVYDPYLHYAMFNGIVGVLNEQAARVFRFKEQEQLHEEIIDAGLAKIYQSHLEIGRRLAAAEGVDLDVRLLDGKCFEKILHVCREERPWLLILGRVGVHSAEGETDLGSNTENLLRLAPCSVLLTGGRFHPPLDVRAAESIAWTAEAEARMQRIPARVAGIARTALLRHAVEQGHTVITSKVIDQAMAIFMPTRLAERVQVLAEDVAVAALRAEGGVTAICSVCGYATRGPSPVVRCPVCDADAGKFVTVDRAALEAIAEAEGGASVEEVMPGVSVRWARDARDGLRAIADPHLRRRAKALIEKRARTRRIPVITRDLAVPLIEEVTGRQGPDAARDARRARPPFESSPAGDPAPPAGAFTWTEEAAARLGRVPAGFMRDLTRRQIERLARARQLGVVDLSLCEEGIGLARSTMNDVIAGPVPERHPG